MGYDLEAAHTAKVYLLEGELTEDQRQAIASALLVNPVTEKLRNGQPDAERAVTLEVHPLPGVMDPAAQSVEEAIQELLGVSVQASTGVRYDLVGLEADSARSLASRLLFNPVVQALHQGAFHPDSLPHGTPYEFSASSVTITSLDDAGLERLSRDGHLFLSLGEMQAIQEHYATIGREPTDIELETLAQTWSEHCVHKTLKSDYRYIGPADDSIDWSNRPGVTIEDGSVLVENLLKNTVAAATHELIAEGVDWALSVFHDNSGVIAFDDDYGVCIKVETHNHPSALEPYGGAATGIGGCIRDIIGTGLAAKPIANTDVFCVAPPDTSDVPAGCIHPKRVLREVVAGVRDYGNRMGIPTLNGAVDFDPRYIGNPLVFAGCIGLIPRDKIDGEAQPGDRIIALGGRTGRDGIHGATFSSAELSDTHADEFSHAVQIGNPIEEKKVLDAIMRARDEHERPLFRAITDCGAGGFSSAVGEMGEKLGADVQLDRAPLKYAGLTYTEIWISEAQERMILAVPEANIAALQSICDEEGVELADLGHYGTPGSELILRYGEHEVGRLPMEFVHGGIPRETLEAAWTPKAPATKNGSEPSTGDALLKLLAQPSIASKHWIIRQYDHEVQGNTVIKPLVGPPAEDGASRGPGDASVIEPVPGTGRGVAIGCGLQARVGDPQVGGDSYLMALAAIDECVRNLVCVGADPSRIAILDNFCWPGVKDAESLGHLVRSAIGCYDGAKAYRTPFVSGKDSLNNQFRTEDGRTIRIPPTLLITGLGIVPDVRKCVTSDAKRDGNTLLFIDTIHEDTDQWVADLTSMGNSLYSSVLGQKQGTNPRVPRINPERCAATARCVAGLLASGEARSAHDVSDGGALVTIAEMLIAGSTESQMLGASLNCEFYGEAGSTGYIFGERAGGYIVEVGNPSRAMDVLSKLQEEHGQCLGTNILGPVTNSGILEVDSSNDMRIPVEELVAAWRGPLDW